MAVGWLAEDVTFSQYAVLIGLAARGPRRLSDLAVELGVSGSTTAGLCDRAVGAGVVCRRRVRAGRRGVIVSLRRRRPEGARTIRRMPMAHRRAALRSLRAFAQATGRAPGQDWPLGWDLDR